MDADLEELDEEIIDVKKLTKILQCNECEFTTRQDSNLRRHKKAVHEGITRTCEDCDYSAPSFSQLKAHIDSTHLIIRHECDVCRKVLLSKPRLMAHKTLHTGANPFCCETFRNNDAT